MQGNTYVKIFLENIFSKKKANKYRFLLERFNIYTVEQLYGAINSSLPKFSDLEINTRALNSKYKFIASKDVKNTSIKKLNNLFENYTDSEKVLKRLSYIKFPVQALRNNDTELSLGVIFKKTLHKSSFWNDAHFNSFKNNFIISNYENFKNVYDQGNRGSCVANAFAFLLEYLTIEENSRQFLYHQCKQIDAWPNQEGTSMDTAIEIISDKNLIDYGCVLEKEWTYVMNKGLTVHQGPPPESCFETDRFIGLNPIYARKNSMVEDIKKMITGSDLHNPMPVAIAVDLYESFSNYSSRSTGWITMPLPGESIIGGHAMVIVGYYDDQEIFLVRNSWGSSWACENMYGFQGHALMPYKYIEKYCRHASGFLGFEKKYIKVAKENRLHNLVSIPYAKNRKLVANNKTNFSKIQIESSTNKNSQKRTKVRKQRKYTFLKFYSFLTTVILVVLFKDHLLKLFEFCKEFLAEF